MNLELKPYGIVSRRADINATLAPFTNKIDGDCGLDAKYSLTKSLTMDLTYKTDFAG